MRTATVWLIALVGLLSALSQRKEKKVNLYIDESQVKYFGGFPTEIYAIADGVVLPYILDENFENFLPVIPSDVNVVNFTWQSGDHKYYYDFDQLKSFNESILRDPLLSIEPKGKIPRKAKVFQIFLPCLGNQSGVATFGIGLSIRNDKGYYLSGTPFRLRLQKQCANHGPDPQCDKKCANGGRCNEQKICECPKGYMGKYCDSALCYPQCLNGGTCVSPGVCSCAFGYIGVYCEGGMCQEKCLNGGACVQKDTCLCRRGYYGKRCAFSKCSIPCLNAGRCIGVNRCRCKKGFSGKQCEGIVERQLPQKHDESCKRKCIHGFCHQKQCMCNKGWFGKRCTRRHPKKRNQ